MYVCRCTFGSLLMHTVLSGLSNSCTICWATSVVGWKAGVREAQAQDVVAPRTIAMTNVPYTRRVRVAVVALLVIEIAL
jgi:hypothetical protein